MKIIFVLVILAFPILAEEFPQTNIRYVLIQYGSLNLREKPVDGKVIAKLNKNSVLRTLGALFAGKWYGFDGSADFIYLMNYFVQSKTNLDILENGKKLGSFKSESISGYGCQDNKAIKGRMSIKTQEKNIHFGAFGIEESKVNYALTEVIGADIFSIFKKEAASILKKNNISEQEFKNISHKKIVQFQVANGKSYLVARYAINKEYIEKHYLSIVAEIQKKNGLKIIRNKFETLREERGSYGGSFHFMSSIDVDGSGIPAILFYHIGFDSGIYELFRIKDDKIESIVIGAGDAC